ncbi:MAG: aminotransferase class I/II-fold pyridoxal phosphate-dependent enzyme [Candidatus Sungbacteria bacterium]|nr:aminotransferase class I/II-fold pyridoxal phosphate-dependent enzyme [Candidatus Sungbacteria bacterium]
MSTYSSLKFKLAENIIDSDDLAALAEWVNRGHQLTKGGLTLEFEKAWASWIGTKHAVFCNSGSSANLLMAHAALLSGKLKNNKVIVPSVGWVTTISPFMQLGFKPIMCGADSNNFGLDLVDLEKLLKKHNPSLVVLVQVLGVPSDMKAIMRLKKKYGFTLLEDACAALGASYADKKVGAFGEMGSFSFYFGHQLSTIEGGMVNTNSKDLYDTMLMLRSHGWGKDLDEKTRAKFMKKYAIEDFHKPFTFFLPGYNLRSTDLNAFLGLRMMKKADSIAAIRNRNHLVYAENLKTVSFQKWSDKAFPCSISFGALARDSKHRKKIVDALDKNGIETRLFSAGNLGLHPFWFEKYGKFSHPVSDRVHSCGFFLPNNETLKEEDVGFIASVVNSIEY